MLSDMFHNTHIYLLSTWLMSQACSIPSISHQIPFWQESFPCLRLVRCLRSLFSNITVNLMLIMDPFNSWLCFHCQRRLVTLFGYDTLQFRQCGIFIYNTEAIPVAAIEPKKQNMLEDNLKLFGFISIFQSHIKDIQFCPFSLFLIVIFIIALKCCSHCYHNIAIARTPTAYYLDVAIARMYCPCQIMKTNPH